MRRLIRRAVRLLLLLISLWSVGCGGRRGDADGLEQRSDTVAVTVMIAEPRDFVLWSIYYGTLAAQVEAQLTTGSGGRVEELNAGEGDTVAAGDILAGIDADEAVSSYQSARLEEKLAMENFQRAQRHRENGTVAPLEVEQARLEWLRARTRLLQASRTRKEALAIAPIDGVVTVRHIRLQEKLPAGVPTFTIVKSDTLKVAIGIRDDDITNVDVGAAAVVGVRAFPDRLWRGEVHSVAGDIDPQTRTYPCEVWIDNSDGALRPGLTARVRVAVLTFVQQVVVPNNAVVTEDRGHYLSVVEDGAAVRKPVRIGPSDSTRTVVLEGVEPGATVVVKGAPLVSTGTPVNITGRWREP